MEENKTIFKDFYSFDIIMIKLLQHMYKRLQYTTKDKQFINQIEPLLT